MTSGKLIHFILNLSRKSLIYYLIMDHRKSYYRSSTPVFKCSICDLPHFHALFGVSAYYRIFISLLHCLKIICFQFRFYLFDMLVIPKCRKSSKMSKFAARAIFCGGGFNLPRHQLKPPEELPILPQKNSNSFLLTDGNIFQQFSTAACF